MPILFPNSKNSRLGFGVRYYLFLNSNGKMSKIKKTSFHFCEGIDVRKGVLGGLTPPPWDLKFGLAPPPRPLENFPAGDPLEQLLGGLGGQ